MFYTIYKITNKINEKFYIGMHQTGNVDDGYMGSGKRIKAAIKKYGVGSFTKEILHIFDNEKDMKNKEKELVVINEMSYNLCEGGKGGFGYINSHLKEKVSSQKRERQKAKPNSYYVDLGNKAAKVSSERLKLFHSTGKIKPVDWTGKKHTEETKQKMRKPKNVGSNNPSYGTCWVSNGQESKKIKKEELDKFIELGYYKGRIMDS